MRICKHGCDITRILIGYALWDARFDWLVGYMSVYQENLFQSRSKKNSIFLHSSNYFWEIFYKSNTGLFPVFTKPHLNRGVGRILDSYEKPETHNCLGFSHLPFVFRLGYVNAERSPLCLNINWPIFKEEISQNIPTSFGISALTFTTWKFETHQKSKINLPPAQEHLHNSLVPTWGQRVCPFFWLCPGKGTFQNKRM